MKNLTEANTISAGEFRKESSPLPQTKPFFLIRKYRSILFAAVVVEVVSYLVSLTDSIVAGNIIGPEALAAVGLLTPFLSAATFLCSIFNTGTVINYSYHISRFDRQRAMEFFSQGIFLGLFTGALYSLLLLFLRDFIIARISVPGEILQHFHDYFNIVLIYYFLLPLVYILYNLIVADGGEKIAAAANVVMIISNVILSLLFACRWGVKGIALASVTSELIFLLLVSRHFFSRGNTLKLIFNWSIRDTLTIIKSGIVKASIYGLEAVMTSSVNLFALFYFDDDTLILLIIVEKYLGLLTVFIGLSMASQPLIGTLLGEKNIRGLRALIKTACLDVMTAGLILSIVSFCCAPLFATAMGLYGDPLFPQAVLSLRIVAATLLFHAVLIQFFIYYILIGRQLLAFLICLLKNLINPVLLAVVLSILLRSHAGLWIGLAAAPIITLLVSAAGIYLSFGRELFPFLLLKDRDDRTLIYAFTISSQAAARMADTAGRVLETFSVPDRIGLLTEVFLEDMLMLILEKNAGRKKPLYAECTLIIEPDGVRLILRDSGVIFNITDSDAKVQSFRQFIVSSLMISLEHRAYLTTTGYNRTELFFSFNQA